MLGAQFESVLLPLLLLVGLLGRMGSIYLAGVVTAAVLLAAEHWLVRRGQIQHVNMAFGTVNAMVSVVVGGTGSLDILLS